MFHVEQMGGEIMPELDDTATRLALLEQRVAYTEEEIRDYRVISETVINLKQSVELLNKTVWGILACLGSAIGLMAVNILFGGVV